MYKIADNAVTLRTFFFLLTRFENYADQVKRNAKYATKGCQTEGLLLAPVWNIAHV